jgi:cobalamin-dependent methionine synthase I
MLVIGQSLECWRPPLAVAVAGRDPVPLLARARGQLAAGAHALDVNFGAQPRAGLAADLAWTALTLREALPGAPLFLDCGDLEALASALEATPGPAVANAVPLDGPPTREVDRLLEAAAASGAGIVCSPRAADREDADPTAILAAAEEFQALARSAGLTGPLYLDCLAYPPASHPAQCRRSLTWLATLRDAGSSGSAAVQPLVAAGNVRHGAPPAAKEHLAAIYVVLAIASGATTLIVRAEASPLMSLISVMESHRSPDTGLDRWALAVQALPADQQLTLPPPGDEARAAWSLLTQ